MLKPFFISILFLSLYGCGQPTLIKETRILMDTLVEISVYSSDNSGALETLKLAFKEIERVEKKFSKFDKESEVSKVNRLATAGRVRISPELFKVIEDSIHYSEISGGSFDITVTSGHKGRYEEIELDKSRLTVYFLNPGVNIDLGGIAKGYAVDRAKDILVTNGVANALINIGGNIYALGSARGKHGWDVGIRDPKDRNKIMDRLNLENKAVSTSGIYERGPHIIDPAIGIPARGFTSVTVVAGSAELADALSTAIFVMGREKSLEFVKSLKEDIEVFVFDESGETVLTGSSSSGRSYLY